MTSEAGRSESKDILTGTLAWPYSRSLYREPLVGLGWSLGLYGLILWRYRGRAIWPVIAGLILLLTLTVKVAAIAALPFIFLAAMAQLRDRKQLGRLAIILLLPPVFALLVLLLLGPGATAGYPGLPAEQGRGLAAWATAGDEEPYTLVTMSNEYHIFYYLGFLKGAFIHHWYSPDQREGFEPILETDPWP